MGCASAIGIVNIRMKFRDGEFAWVIKHVIELLSQNIKLIARQ